MEELEELEELIGSEDRLGYVDATLEELEELWNCLAKCEFCLVKLCGIGGIAHPFFIRW